MALKAHYRECNVAYYLPTYPLIEDIAFERFPELCERKGWAYKLRKSNSPQIEFPGAGKLIFRTMENPERIVGYEVAHSIVDELDTLAVDKARRVWSKIIARNRQKCGMRNTVGVVTTPEGFRFVYDRWVKNGKPGYALFKARTIDNAANLPENYISDMQDTYSAAELAAYLEGEFVNLTAGSVYAEFDRKLNASTEQIKPKETLHIGMDFNVTNMAAVVHVLRGDDPHAVAELTGVFDTPSMIKILKERFAEHSIMVYPDASGDSRKSVNASASDISLLSAARFRVCANSTNPRVKDRVLSVNAMIHRGGKRRYHINIQACPQLVESFEKQAYDKNGEPDKTAGFDHILDAAGYFLVYRYPIVRRVMTASALKI